MKQTRSGSGTLTKVAAARDPAPAKMREPSGNKPPRLGEGILITNARTGKVGHSGKGTPTRPSGKDVTAYEGNDQWTARRWAWEFLTRNDKFRAACDKVDLNDSAGQAEIAETFGLKRFKSYLDPYEVATGKKRTGRPVFIHGAISVKSNMDPKSEKEGKVRKVSFSLGYGQVAILFNLAETMDHEAALTAQIRAATNSLERRQKKFKKNLGGISPPKRTAHPDVFLTYVRILDLLAAKHGQNETLRILYPEMKDKTADLRDQKKQQITGALDCAETRYRHIANMQFGKKK